MDILQRNCLGADVATTQRVIVVTANINDLITLRADDQAAHGLAQMADPVMCLGDSVAHSCLALTVPEGPQSQAGVVLRIRPYSSIGKGLLCRALWAGKISDAVRVCRGPTLHLGHDRFDLVWLADNLGLLR